EARTRTLNGSISDSSPPQTHTLTVDWGDGTVPLTQTLGAGVLTFSVQHAYLHNNPTGSPPDVFPITVSVTGVESPPVTATLTVTVHHVAPQVSAGPEAFIAERTQFVGSATVVAAGRGVGAGAVHYGGQTPGVHVTTSAIV